MDYSCAFVFTIFFLWGFKKVTTNQFQVKTMNCPSCNTPLPPEATFCSKCGFQVKLACPRCNAILASGEAFCSNCGTPLHAQQKSRWVYGLLALLTPFGIHDFYAGRIKSAIIIMAIELLSCYLLRESITLAKTYGHHAGFGPAVADFYAMNLIIVSIIFRLVECVAVKRDGKGVKMK